MISRRGRKNKQPNLVGHAFDAKKGDERRITLGEGFVIHGGSKETHEKMQEQGCRMSEEAAKKGKTLQQLSGRETREVMEKVLIREERG